jgi:hypothetical protein
LRDIDKIVAALLKTHPQLLIEQLRVAHPGADDDGIWFIEHPAASGAVQLESWTGNCPFIVESDRNADVHHATTVLQAVSIVTALLGLSAIAT